MVENESAISLADRIAGAILGVAVGDALGLPREGLSRRRARRLFGTRPFGHRFFLGWGMVSDDTEHTCMTGQALLRAPDNPAAFARSLGRSLRYWMLSLPAGAGYATLRATIRLMIGFSPQSSGVFSAGNGPAMRAPILGVCLGDRPERLRAYTRASTCLTHTDPRAESGALLVALATQEGSVRGANGIEGDRTLQILRDQLENMDHELAGILDKLAAHLHRQAPAEELAEAMGQHSRVSGYMYHTVPLALYCWLRSPGDFRLAVEEAIDLGGDADTLGAIVGGIAGATLGVQGIPPEWIAGLLEWPRSTSWMRKLAARLALQFQQRDASIQALGPLPVFWPGLLLRNLWFLSVVMAHIVRRGLPPY